MSNNRHDNSSKSIPKITEDSLRQGQKYQVGKYFILDDRGIYHITQNPNTGEEKVDRVAGTMFITESSRNIDEEKVYVNLKYKQHGIYCESIVRKVELSIPNELVKLNDTGAEIPYEYRNLLVMYFREQEKKAIYKEVYTKMGFYLNEKNEWEYFHSEVIPQRKLPTVFDEERGKVLLTPKGTLDAWVKMVKRDVIGYIPSEFILAVGLSAPIVGYLSQVIDVISTIFVHLNTDSTVGKTSASMLAVSPFGFANHKSPNSLVKDWGSTTNRITEDFNRNMGVPIVLDELSMNNEKELTALFYTISSGKGKGRLTDKIEKQDRATWATSMISNGEISAFLRANKNKGLKVRVKQFNGITWTKSSDNADEMRQDIQNNYGYAGIEFVKYMFKKGLPEVESLWRTWLERVRKALPQTDVSARVAIDYAVIMTAATLANEALELGLCEEGILDFIVEHEENAAATRDVGTLAYEEIKQVLIQHQANFRHEGQSLIPQNCWGKIIYHADHVEFAVLKDVMKQQLQERDYENMATVLKDWDKVGVLKTEGDRKSARSQIFSKDEQEERKQALGGKVPKKLEDTTYNLLIPKEELEGMLARRRTNVALSNSTEVEVDLLDN